MANPFFHFLHTHRNTSDKTLLHPSLQVPKRYEAADTVELSVPEKITESISDLLTARESCRAFQGKTLSIENISTILYWSMSEQAMSASIKDPAANFKRRPHPSGGAKFPVEAYLLLDEHAQLNTGIYHYRPDTHTLEKVRSVTTEEIAKVKQSYVYDFVTEIPVLILFSYIMERNVPKYGSFGAKLALIEAGHIGQNIATIAKSQDVDSVMLAGGDFDMIDSLFEFDSYNESTFYTIGLGKNYSENL